ncbi:MAG: PQQ-binding-like beta-propeller repeat protein [Tepidisphaeraceae bacterium]
MTLRRSRPIVVVITLALLALTSIARADFTFIHASDPHFNTKEGPGTNAGNDAERYKEISALNPQPKFIVQTGDIVEIGTVEEYDVLRRTLADSLKIPLYNAPGNHDVRWNPIGKEGYVKGVGQPLYQSWDYENVHFVTLDSTVLLQHWGHISKDQLDWLKADLDKVGKEKPIIIGFHHWIGRDTVQTDNEQQLMDLVAPYNVVLWLQGHGHSDIQWNVNGVPAIMQKGLYQGSYSVIDVTADTMKVRRRAIGAAKKNSELVRDKSVPNEPEVTWTDLMTIPLKKQTPPKWDATVSLGDKLSISAKRGDLPDDAKLGYRVNSGKYIDMTPKGDEWVAEAPTKDLIAGEQVITVQALLADGRAYQKPLKLMVEQPGAPKALWSGNLKGAIQSKLVRAGDNLFVTTMGGDLVGLDPNTGDEKWRVKTEGPVFSTPHVDNGVVYFGSTDHQVYAVDAKTGDVKWKTKTEGGVFAGPAVAKGIVVIPSVDKKIYGLDANTGDVKWTLPVDGMVQSKCATDGERVFIGDWVNTLRAIDVARGEEIWAVKMGRTKDGRIATPYSPAISSPAVGDGKVYVTTNDGVIHALDAKTGHMAWEWWEKDKNKLGYSGPLFHDGKIYIAIGDEGRTFCIDAMKGELLWQCDTGSVIYDSSFAFAGGNVFIGCVAGEFNAIDASSGKIVWKYRLAPGHLLASPATDEKNVYIGTMSGQIIALPANVPAVAQTRAE